jgi:hypothetical protein
MDSSISAKDEIWFLRVYHHISNALYYTDMFRALTYLLANQLSGRFEHEEFYHVCLPFGVSFVCLENIIASLCVVTFITIVLIMEAFNLLSGFKL